MHKIRFTAGATAGRGTVDERFGRVDHVSFQQVVVLALQVLTGCLCAVPLAVAIELAAGGLQVCKEMIDLRLRSSRRCRRGRRADRDGKSCQCRSEPACRAHALLRHLNLAAAAKAADAAHTAGAERTSTLARQHQR